MAQYLTAPVPSTKMPRGIPYIIGNEAAERFSFYGMKGILTIFMTKHLLDASGQPDYMTDEEAKTVYHLFTAAAYFFPIIGSLFSDIIWGKYKTIIILSLGYCIGHACIALGDTGLGTMILQPRWWLFLGLVFIAIGAGGIKPCVSAHVGDQFGKKNQHLVSKIFSWFYFSINVGAALSTLLTPIFLNRYGPWLAFGVPGLLMALATFIFWLGRNKFVHIPPGGTKFFRESLSPEGKRAILNLSPIFLIFIPMFWAIFDQTGSAWVLQADSMDRHFMGVHWLPSQIQAVNPLLILILIPTFSYVIYPTIDKFFKMTPLRKMSIGFFATVIACSASALIEEQISGGDVLPPSSISPTEGWTRQGIIDGPADGFGWSSSPEGVFPLKVDMRLRERAGWTISSVAINPYTVVGPADDTDEAEQARRAAMTDAEREGFEAAEDRDNWARSVTVLVRDDEVEGAGTAEVSDDAWLEVGTIELAQENALQTLAFDPVRATHVRLRVDSNWGGDRAKLGEVQVLTVDPMPVEGPSNREDAWPDVAAVGFKPNIGWQFLAYILITAAEVMVSITSLEFAYTQAPKKMKSFIMGIYFLGISLGNLFTAGVNFFIQNDDGSTKLEGAAYYWFFTAIMAVVAVIFVVYAQFYKGRTFVQGEETIDPDDAMLTDPELAGPHGEHGQHGAPPPPEDHTFGEELKD